MTITLIPHEDQCEHLCMIAMINDTKRMIDADDLERLFTDLDRVLCVKKTEVSLFNFCPFCGQEVNRDRD